MFSLNVFLYSFFIDTRLCVIKVSILSVKSFSVMFLEASLIKMYIHWTIFRFFFTSFSVCPDCRPIGLGHSAGVIQGLVMVCLLWMRSKGRGEYLIPGSGSAVGCGVFGAGSGFRAGWRAAVGGGGEGGFNHFFLELLC